MGLQAHGMRSYSPTPTCPIKKRFLASDAIDFGCMQGGADVNHLSPGSNLDKRVLTHTCLLIAALTDRACEVKMTPWGTRGQNS